MKSLQQIKHQLEAGAELTTEELSDILGGRRLYTTSYSIAMYYYNYLRGLGYNASTANHNGTYCVDW